MNKMIISFTGIVLAALLSCSCSKGGNGGDVTPPVDESKIFYVAVSGSDDNAGTKEAPFKTVNYALSKAKAGDTVLVRGGTYAQKVSFPKSGTTDKRITLKAYPGETPILSGEGMSVSGVEALITISNVRNITVSGFEVSNYKTVIPHTEVNGIMVNAGASNITVSGNHVHHLEDNTALSDGSSAHAILVIGNTDVPLKNILVEGNIIHDCKTGYSESLTINGYVDGFVVRGNKVYNVSNLAIDAAGGYAANPVPAYNYARNGLICENEVYNAENSRGPIGGYGAIGIYVDGARNITVERNKVYNCDRGVGIVSETNDFPTKDCIVRNNLVYNCWRTGVYMGGYLGHTGGGTSGCYIVNNTLYNNNRVLGYFNEIEGEIRITENCSNNVIENNLIYAGANDLFVHKYSATGTNNNFNNNLYFGPGRWLWNSTNGAPITDFSIWKSTCGGDANAIYNVDPLLVNKDNADFHISSSSPAKNAGRTGADVSVYGDKDLGGNPRIVNGNISIGAYQ